MLFCGCVLDPILKTNTSRHPPATPINTPTIRPMLFILLAFGMTFTSAAVTPPTTTTLDDYLSFTTRSQLTAWDGGGETDAIAWVEITRGISNIFMAHRKTSWAPVQLTQYKKDAAIDLAIVGFFSVDVLHFTLAASEGVNALNLKTGIPSSTLWGIHTDQGKLAMPTLLFNATFDMIHNGNIIFTEEYKWSEKFNDHSGAVVKSQKLSASGMALASSGGGDAAAAAAPKTLFTMPQGRVYPTSWSPDGSKMVFVSDRGDHS